MALMMLASLYGCEATSECDTRILQVDRDTGSDRYAVTEVKNCGATTDYATIVRVGRASRSQSEAIEVFVADSDGGAATNDERGSIWLNVVWTAPGQLSITHASRARVFKRVGTANGAKIRIRPSAPYALPPPS